MTDNSAYIRLNNISKHFGNVVAVDRVNFNIAGGEFFSLLGASGCGKTTLLRMLAGFEGPTIGEIYIDDEPMSQVAPHQRPTNMVFQSYAIFPHLNVQSNIAYGLRREKLDKATTKRRVDEALAMVKLSGFGERRSDELSGGQRQRVALARALIKRPKVLLLDEPLGALDKKLREEMQLELRSLQQSLGITFIFVTHDQEEAMTLSDRVAVMAHGNVLQIGSPKELYNRPESVEVAEFIGQMNFVAASVIGTDKDQAAIDAGCFGRVTAANKDGAMIKGDRIVVAVRPEKLQISHTRGRAKHAVQGVIRAAAYLGDRSHFYVAVAGNEKPLAVAAQEVGTSVGKTHAEQSDVWISWPDDALIFLPPA
jgi:spermidine/putrescine ABC transporter ATP-binding subunit